MIEIDWLLIEGDYYWLVIRVFNLLLMAWTMMRLQVIIHYRVQLLRVILLRVIQFKKNRRLLRVYINNKRIIKGLLISG